MRSGSGISSRDARWLALAAQGLGRSRPAVVVGPSRLRAVVRALGAVQLDAINVVARTQHLVVRARVGPHDVDRLPPLAGPGGGLLEYWGHAASLLPVEDQPVLRWRMAQGGPYGDRPGVAARRAAWHEAHAGYVAAVLDEVRDRGPLRAADLSDPRPRQGEWWGRRSVGRQALEWLFDHGELAGWRTPSFEKVYDLPERVLPEAVRAAPTPPVEEAHRRLVALAAAALGVATVRDLADYYGLGLATTRSRVPELVEAGDLVEVRVDGWSDPAYVAPGSRPARPRREHATLLSPFDSLIWDRRRTQRLFGFDYRIEVYVPAPRRRYGYYVLPLLLGDALVARLDLKADRAAGALRVLGAHLEEGHDAVAVSDPAATELAALATWLGLDRVTVGRRGDLAVALGRAVRAARAG